MSDESGTLEFHCIWLWSCRSVPVVVVVVFRVSCARIEIFGMQLMHGKEGRQQYVGLLCIVQWRRVDLGI